MNTCFAHKQTRTIADLMEHPSEPRSMVINRINVPAMHRGKGFGRRILHEILKEADFEGVTLYLEVVPSGGLRWNELKAWYERAGFRDCNSPLGRMMKREPVKMTTRSYSQDLDFIRSGYANNIRGLQEIGPQRTDEGQDL